jgi:hypothetical protein
VHGPAGVGVSVLAGQISAVSVAVGEPVAVALAPGVGEAGHIVGVALSIATGVGVAGWGATVGLSIAVGVWAAGGGVAVAPTTGVTVRMGGGESSSPPQPTPTNIIPIPSSPAIAARISIITPPLAALRCAAQRFFSRGAKESNHRTRVWTAPGRRDRPRAGRRSTHPWHGLHRWERGRAARAPSTIDTRLTATEPGSTTSFHHRQRGARLTSSR